MAPFLLRPPHFLTLKGIEKPKMAVLCPLLFQTVRLRPPAGYGYSDAHVLRDGSVAMAFQRTFDPPVPSIEGGGYDIGLAIATP